MRTFEQDRRSRRFAARVALAVAGCVGLVVTIAPVASAETYRGNMCGNVYSSGPSWYVDNGYGSEACVDRGTYAVGKYFYMTPSAYDYKANAKSALNDWKVLQYYDGGWRLSQSGTCVASAGSGYSEVCAQRLISRKKNSSGQYIASRVALQMRSCNYDSGARVRSACTRWVTSFNVRWSTLTP